MRDEHFRAYFRTVLEKAGIDEDSVAAKLREGMDAVQYGLTRNGDVVPMGPDAHAQAKFTDMVLKVMDVYPNQRLDIRAQVSGSVVVLREQDGIAASDPWAGDWIDGESHPVE